MADQVWKEFFDDEMTWKAFNNSEVFQAYAKAEMKREASRALTAVEEKLDEDAQLMRRMDEFRQKLAANPELCAHLRRAKAALEADPELAKKVDPNFINGIKLLDFEV